MGNGLDMASLEVSPVSTFANWFCQIGETERGELPHECDGPMREAVREAYLKITGKEPKFIFSGWGDELQECRRAVVENREPDPQKIRAELEAELRILPV
jgi:hypothetical protein